MPHLTHTGTVVEMPGTSTTERAACELCGHVVATTNGGRHTAQGFVTFERLLDLHMEQRHANLCVLPVREELKPAA